MCGIYFSISPRSDVTPNDYLRDALRARGPDRVGTKQFSLSFPWPISSVTPSRRPLQTHIYIVSTLLSLRGDELVPQPLVDPSTSCCLAWNGEAWSIGPNEVAGNDALAVFSLLLGNTLKRSILPQEESEPVERPAFLHGLGCVVGPFSFVYYDAIHHRVLFGRDRLGRRSLMFRKGDMGEITIASVSDGEGEWSEVKADGVYEIDLENSTVANKIVEVNTHNPLPRDLGIQHLPWQEHHFSSRPNALRKEELFYTVAETILSSAPLNRSMENEEKVCLSIHSRSVTQLGTYLRRSLRLRIQNISDHNKEAMLNASAKVAILFSGGVDCSVIARMVHDILPQDQEIDLLNIAFENPRSIAAATEALKNKHSPPTEDPYSACPDRLLGVISHKELQKICPSRRWRFVSIDISYAEMLSHRDKVISLMYPHNTEMDFSIACALYFAARGQGVLTEKSIAQPYTTSARVLLSGLGADELFAGYVRHATAFRRDGYRGLLDELELDINRLSERNLGRDDRVISQWGKEVRYPFLDDDLVKWAVVLPLWEKCGFGREGQEAFCSPDSAVVEPRIEPAKQVLRLLAWKLGMSGAAMQKKRAIQFGARTAKMTSGKTKGTDVVR